MKKILAIVSSMLVLFSFVVNGASAEPCNQWCYSLDGLDTLYCCGLTPSITPEPGEPTPPTSIPPNIIFPSTPPITLPGAEDQAPSRQYCSDERRDELLRERTEACGDDKPPGCYLDAQEDPRGLFLSADCATMIERTNDLLKCLESTKRLSDECYPPQMWSNNGDELPAFVFRILQAITDIDRETRICKAAVEINTCIPCPSGCAENQTCELVGLRGYACVDKPDAGPIPSDPPVSFPTDPCAGQCASNQTCEFSNLTYTCVDEPTPADPCSGQCNPNQTCEIVDNGYTCVTKDPCSGQCGPNQTCQFVDTGYTCVTPALQGEGESCDSGQGKCINVNTTSCSGGTVKSGLCPGPATVKCCSTSALPGVGNACDFNGQFNQGRCINTNTTSCSGIVKSGQCPGPASVKCCSNPAASGPL